MNIYKILFRVMLPMSILIPLVILLQYRLHMSGSISNDPQHWSVFGSVLGGTFTLVGGLATTLTLLFLNQQQKKNSEVMIKQISSLTFEQYLKHLEHFKAFMESVGRRNSIHFQDLDRLYQFIFPENRPTSCQFIIDPGEQSVLGDLSRCLESMILHIKNPKFQTPTDNSIICLALLKKQLFISFDSHFRGYGDVQLGKVKTGLFLDRLEVQVKAVESVVDEIMFFSGNKRISGSKNIIDWLTPALELIKIISTSETDSIGLDHSSRGATGLLKIHKIIHSSNSIENLKKEVDEIYSGVGLVHMLQPIYAKSKGKILAKSLKAIPNYDEIKHDSEIEIVRSTIIEFFDYDYRFFQ